MADGMEITITVDHGVVDFMDEARLAIETQLIEDAENRLVIIKKANCCKQCRANENALLVIPIGNGLHPHCSCYAVEIDENGNETELDLDAL